MPRAKVRTHNDAADEVRAATRWYLARSGGAAEGFLTEYDDAIERVRRDPLMWPIHLYGTRCLQLHRYPYLIIYRVAGQQIDVLAVAHTSRRPGYWKDRRIETN